MAGGWGNVGADDTDAIMEMLNGEDDGELSGKGGGMQKYPRGFAGMTVTSITTGNTTPCQCPIAGYMRVKRLLLGAAACVDLSYVQDLKIGTISLNLGTAPMPCVAFARDAVGTQIEAAVWATSSIPPTVYIYNNTGGTIVYAGGVFGWVTLQKPADAP